MRRILLVPVFALLVAPLQAADDLKAAEEKVMEYLKKINGAERARITPIQESVAKAFPKHQFIAVLYPQFPVGRPAPEPLKTANVLVVTGDGQVIPLTDVKELGKFVTENAARKGMDFEGEATKAWLRLSAELAQDGFFKFKRPEILDGKGSSDGKESQAEIKGKIEVEPIGGNKGEITATLYFKNNAIIKIDYSIKLVPGIRPRCQATKLLDPDPIVRQMAEDSIRVMGSACKYYLDEQRAKASPELQKAIDRIWQKILDEGR